MNVDHDVKAVGTLHDRHAAGFESDDAGAVAAYSTEDAVLMFPNQPDHEGMQAIQAMFEHYFKQDAAKPKHLPLEIQAAGDWAYGRGNITENVTPKSGKPMENSIKYLLILRGRMARRRFTGTCRTAV